MHARPLPTLVLAALSLLVAASCRREQKPPVRTEPWPAPGLSGSSAASAPARSNYRVTRGRATVELPMPRRPRTTASTSKRRLQGVLTGFDGSLDVDFENPRLTRGRLRVDLRSITFDDADPTSTADEWNRRLELHDEEHRYAELVLTALDPGSDPGSTGDVSVQGELTLHGFRVPVVLELSVERGGAGSASPGSLRVRTRRPLAIPLMAYGLMPEPSADSPPENQRRLGTEANISAEIEAEPSAAPTAP